MDKDRAINVLARLVQLPNGTPQYVAILMAEEIFAKSLPRELFQYALNLDNPRSRSLEALVARLGDGGDVISIVNLPWAYMGSSGKDSYVFEPLSPEEFMRFAQGRDEHVSK